MSKLLHTKHALIGIQAIMHGLFVYGLFVYDISLVLLAVLIAHVIWGGGCSSALFHRCIAHKNALNPIYKRLLLWVSTIGATGSAIAWVGTHRVHHRFADTEGDAHSPKYKGLLGVYVNPFPKHHVLPYVKDLLRDHSLVLQHKWYYPVLLTWHFVIYVGFGFTIYWFLCVVPAVVMWFGGAMVNMFSHDKNGPKDSTLVGVLCAGEGWHKKHHESPKDPIFHPKLDWGGFIYKLLSRRAV